MTLEVVNDLQIGECLAAIVIGYEKENESIPKQGH
jgi:hypothetical protein